MRIVSNVFICKLLDPPGVSLLFGFSIGAVNLSPLRA